MAENKLLKTLKKLGQEPSNYVVDPYDQQSMYEDIASSTQLTPEEVAGIAGVESEFGKYDQPLAGGSARGTFQLMPNTIRYLKERLDSEPEINPLREESRLTSELINQHSKELQKTLGKDVTPEVSDIYVKHNLGDGKARKLLKAADQTPVEMILSEQIIEGNPSLYKGKTKKQALEEIKKRLDTKSKEFKFENRGPLGFLED